MNIGRSLLPRAHPLRCTHSLRHLPTRPISTPPIYRSSTTSSAYQRVDHAEEKENQTVAAMGRTKSGKALKIRKYPTFERLEDERLYRKQHLAAAYRVFAERGFDEGVA